MANHFKTTLLLAFSLLTPNLSAIVVANTNPNDPVYLSSITAVGKVSLAGGLCSGSLLSTGMHMLTAAHCMLDSNGTPLAGTATVTFYNASNIAFDYFSSDIVTYPGFNPFNFFDGNDLAIITLGNVVDASIDRLSLYNGTGELGETATIVGYGRSGIGSTGSVAGTFGTRRQGLNVVDDIFNNILIFDFDNGLAAQNTIGGTGLGTAEVITASGDSGGAVLIDGQLAGIHSFVSCIADPDPNIVCLSPPDINTTLNSTYGEQFGSTRVSAYNSWIQGVIEPAEVPEPSTVAAGLLALVTCLARVRKTRTGSPS